MKYFTKPPAKDSTKARIWDLLCQLNHDQLRLAMTLRPIGYLQTCYPDKFGVPRQASLVRQARGRLKLLPEFQPKLTLQGFEGFSHLWLVFGFHLNEDKRFHAKVHPPRLGGASVGVFASRSPHRPNPLGLSLLKIEKIESDYTLVLMGVDMVDQTPVYDIKPYLPHIESIPDAHVGWAGDLIDKQINIFWTAEQLRALADWEARSGRKNLQELIEETLRLDPRPNVYKGFEGQLGSPFRSVHAVRFYEGDVHFRFISGHEVQIVCLITDRDQIGDRQFELKS